VAVAAFIGSEHTSLVTSGGTDLRERAGDVLEFFLGSLRTAAPTKGGRER